MHCYTGRHVVVQQEAVEVFYYSVFTFQWALSLEYDLHRCFAFPLGETGRLEGPGIGSFPFLSIS